MHNTLYPAARRLGGITGPWILAAALLAAVAEPARPAPPASKPYACIPLGSLGGNFTRARGINSAGEVVGHSSLPGTEFSWNRDERAFVWKDANGNNRSDTGEMVPLPNLGYNSLAFAINNWREAVGHCKPSATEGYRAVLWDCRANPPTVVDLNQLLQPADAANWTLTIARDLNDHGQIVGSGTLTLDGVTYPGRAWLLDWATGVLTDLGTLPGHTGSGGTGLNNLSVPAVVGVSTGSSSSIAFLLAGTAPLRDFSPLTLADDVNGSGQVVGVVNGHPAYAHDTNGNGQLEADEWVDIGCFGPVVNHGLAEAINSSGLVVGNTGGAKKEGGYILQRAFRWQAGTAVTSKQDLNGLTSAPFTLRQARDVNDGGLIVANGNTSALAEPNLACLLKPN